MENTWWGFFGASVLFLAMWSFYLPHHYLLDNEKVVKKSIFGEERKTWREIRSISADRRGVLLSPFPHPTRLAKFRGISVQFGAGNRKEVLEFIRARIGSGSGDARPSPPERG
ncbi:hypothetical protein JW921_04655 [Candidatus Fermentibacterales bacterium]|nr:hypothetical protein [Candidatus Fermentibacterales bacterium]